MDRRGFLKSILAAGVAPAFIGSSILMPVRKIWTPTVPLSYIGANYIFAGKAGRIWVITNNGAEEITVSGIEVGEQKTFTPRPVAVSPGHSIAYQENVAVWTYHTNALLD